MFLTPYHTTAGKGMLNEANKIVNIIKSVKGYNEGIVTIYHVLIMMDILKQFVTPIIPKRFLISFTLLR